MFQKSGYDVQTFLPNLVGWRISLDDKVVHQLRKRARSVAATQELRYEGLNVNRIGQAAAHVERQRFRPPATVRMFQDMFQPDVRRQSEFSRQQSVPRIM